MQFMFSQTIINPPNSP